MQVLVALSSNGCIARRKRETCVVLLQSTILPIRTICLLLHENHSLPALYSFAMRRAGPTWHALTIASTTIST
eukprot:6214287-Pleurochrysis_carterae.AAC.4